MNFLPIPEALRLHHEKTQLRLMKQWQVDKRVTPVLLFSGAAGIGKRTWVRHLSQWILCERSGLRNTAGAPKEIHDEIDLFGAPSAKQDREPLLKPCGECINCQRALKESWVDFTEITPTSFDDPNEKSDTTLKIDQFRKLKSTLGFGSHEGSYKIISIPNAEKMTVQAANSVLKLLEEPPAGWIFFLTTSDSSLILATILSRAQQIRMLPIPEADLSEILAAAPESGKESSPEKRSLIARLAQGSWGRALELLEPGNWEKRLLTFKFLEDPATQLTPMIDWAASEPEAFALVLDQLESLCGEFSRWSLESHIPPERYAWLNSDGRESIVGHIKKSLRTFGSPSQASHFWIEQAGRISRARKEILAPLNKKNLAQDVLLPWLLA